MNVRMNYWNIMFSTPCPVVGGRVKSCDGSTFTYGRSRFCISNNCLLKLWKDGRSSQSRDQQASIISYLEKKKKELRVNSFQYTNLNSIPWFNQYFFILYQTRNNIQCIFNIQWFNETFNVDVYSMFNKPIKVQ